MLDFRALSCFSFEGYKWGFPKIRGTVLGVPIISTTVYWGPY